MFKTCNIHLKYETGFRDSMCLRFYAQYYQGGGELDLVLEASDNRTLVVEVKKHKTKIGHGEVEAFAKKVTALRAARPDREVVPAFLALGGFTDEALALCVEYGVGFASRLNYVTREWRF